MSDQVKASTVAPLKYFQLSAFVAVYILSNVFRTLPAVVAPGIGQDFALSIQSVGYFSAAYNFAFGAMQLFVGIAIDRFGPGRTVTWSFAVATFGSFLSCIAPNFPILLVSQVLIGIGCSAVFLGSLVFVSKYFSPDRFAVLSGLVLGLGGLGMLITATPLAYVVEMWSWRAAFIVVSLAAVFAIAACFLWVDKKEVQTTAQETVGQSFRLVGSLLRRRGTVAILLLGGVCYACMISFRGFWIVPFLSERQGLSLIQSGNVVLVLSVLMTLSPFVFGWIDPGGKSRRYLIVASALAMSVGVLWLGFSYQKPLTTTLIGIVAIGALSGFTILQYADVRSSYEPAVIGRALSLLNMSVFLGAAIVQMMTAVVSDLAVSGDADSLQWVFLSLSSVVVVGCVGFCLLPAPPKLS
ncbi:MAG: MFS transporter [Afipia sp.]|nr:MFS transporter [Afipia sp.]